MHGQDAYGPRDEGPGELPELPIARPGERMPDAAPPRVNAPASGNEIQPPLLGASFTTAGAGEPVRPQDADDETPPHDLQLLTWELAARLTSGMLANPGRSHSSVKDAMGLFDQFLHEMNAYVRIAAEYDLDHDNAARRRAHGEYFRGSSEAADDSGSGQPGHAAAPGGPDRPRPSPPKPAPAQPRPGEEYRAIPPGLRGPYTPGSMAGPPPPATDPDADEPRRAA